MITITDLKLIEEEYVSSKITYRELSLKHKIPMHKLARFALRNNWSAKRRAYVAPSTLPVPSLDVSRLARSSDALESILESAFLSASSADSPLDTKSLKDLTSTLKEAINIKQNLYLLPVLTEQKQLELQTKKAPSAGTADEIRVTLENGADKYCV